MASTGQVTKLIVFVSAEHLSATLTEVFRDFPQL